MEHLNDTEAMHKIFQASNGEPQEVVEIVSAAILEKTNHMLAQMFNPPRPAAPENEEQYQLFHPETLPIKVQEKRAEGYLELLSIVCKAEEMEIGRIDQHDQEAIEDELPIQVDPEMQVEEEEEAVILPDIEDIVFEDVVEPMEVD
ncbi:hypothetical protein CAEBREN_13925 [Caenorhabditis brenneri]|uniref:Uncharacterized protein n=1 Tax=Caenorhabditis brenneri TaxID=135651 RepID=G0P4H0_CAEBE|nr:hypothetical protein CAEBREN_13925 [Caenorhabditis brenneri]